MGCSLAYATPPLTATQWVGCRRRRLSEAPVLVKCAGREIRPAVSYRSPQEIGPATEGRGRAGGVAEQTCRKVPEDHEFSNM